MSKSNVSIERVSAPSDANADMLDRGRRTRLVVDEELEFAFTIDPVRTNGIVQPFWPYQDPRYVGRKCHRWGEGPFCEFDGKLMPYKSGAYLLYVHEQIMYVGYGDTLRPRFESYGKIRAENCLVGERSNRPQTTARINHLIYETYADSGSVDVWIRITDAFKTVEEKLIH